VRVAPPAFCNEPAIRRLANRTLRLLDGLLPSPTGCTAFARGDFELRGDFLGEGYARATAEATSAVADAESSGLALDGTYTGKAMAALLQAARDASGAPRTLLFVNTYDSRGHPGGG
jgi:D-cysteine desulfhydrase